MILSRALTGGLLVVFGIFMLGVGFKTSDFIVSLIIGIVSIGLGFFILLNSREDKIEEIKSRRKK